MSDDERLLTFVRALARGDREGAASVIAASPDLALACLARGATRQSMDEFYVHELSHYLYAGDTALHVASAAHEPMLVRQLASAGAFAGAANRRGAQPLHYAADGSPDAASWNPAAQGDTVRCLVALGADPNARDKNGTTPLHRAVRNRCAAAVEALLEAGADPRATTRRGSTALHLARWTTGRSGSGSREARAQRHEILRLLDANECAGAHPVRLAGS